MVIVIAIAILRIHIVLQKIIFDGVRLDFQGVQTVGLDSVLGLGVGGTTVIDGSRVIQNITGLASQIRSAQSQNPSRRNDLQVRMELMADCYAGVWAGKNRRLIEPGDMEEGMRAASAIGDDTLMRRAGQRINPENFTHGTSAQRMDALRRGLQSADSDACNVYFE